MRRVWRLLRLDRPPPGGLDRAVQTVARWWLPFLLLFTAVLYLPLLDARPLRFEEGRRAVQALEILAGGSWWYLEVLGEPYVNKPPLLPWLMVVASWFTGGLNEWAVRLPAVVSVAVGAVSAGAMARLLVPARGRLAALAAGVAFLSCAFIFTKARLGETDTLVTAFCGLAFLVWAWARMRGQLNGLAWFAVWAFLAAAAFTKGPIPLFFPAVALLLVPLLQRRWREAALALLVLVLSLGPLGLWAAINLADDGIQGWAREMRVGGRGGPGPDYWWGLLHLNQVPNAIVYTLPWCLPAALLVGASWSERRQKGWPVLALLLFAVPFALVVLLWSEARPRYAMPIVWPVAALAGGWIALTWQRGRLAIALLVGGALFIVIHQAILLGIFEGRTKAQVAYRAKVEALATAVAPLPAGTLLLVDSAVEPDHDALAYAGRPLQRIRIADGLCPKEGQYLLVSEPDRAAVEASGDWSLKADIAGTWMGLYERDSARCPLGR
ncbi:MAG: glycosyltransferase family 39 protein [Kiloniellales bacterium]